MKTWIILSLVVGLLLVAGIFAVNAFDAGIPAKVQAQGTAKALGCSSCGGSCSAEKNCGLKTCGAMNGGTCGCGK